MRPRFLLLLPLALLAACATPDAPDDPDRTAPPEVGDIAGPGAAPTVERGPNEVIRIDPALVGVATVEDSLDTYDLTLARLELLLGRDGGEADSVAVQRWLARFAPLDALGTYDDLDPEAMTFDYTSLVTFQFEDGSARNVYFQKQPDGLAVLSQADGPVWRLAPEAYRRLVPPADSLRAR